MNHSPIFPISGPPFSPAGDYPYFPESVFRQHCLSKIYLFILRVNKARHINLRFTSIAFNFLFPSLRVAIFLPLIYVSLQVRRRYFFGQESVSTIVPSVQTRPLTNG